ncbi:MAG: response regulator [Telmatospirillum sp.]|nr:response regulator [Telmatospirillum sp.]
MSKSQRILVIDDDPGIGVLLKRCLAIGGFDVETTTDGATMRRLLRQQTFDMIILDLNLKGEDGLDILRELRTTEDIPVIILSARGEHVDTVVGLELGADDYIAKPFEPRELLARVRTVLRRAAPRSSTSQPAAAEPVLMFCDWQMDLRARELRHNINGLVTLTPAQFDILATFVTHPNHVLSRDQILDATRHRSTEPFDRSIDVHISQIRRKIEKDPRNPEIIKTIYGIGYIFTPIPRTA